jgi:hypothetical protein
MTVKVNKSWANCSEFLMPGEYVMMPDELGKDLARTGIVEAVSKVPEGVKVRDISDRLVEVV